jgi:CheY-like chemotaxis protein
MSHSILYLEDSDICFEVATLMLEEIGEFDIKRASSISECKNIMAENNLEQYCLIILDIMLPDGDSSVLLPLIKQQYNKPVIAFTARSGLADIEQLKSSGFDYVLPKPISFDSFKAVLASYGLPQ